MKYFITVAVLSLMAASAYAGGMPEELIEPTMIVVEAIDTSPTLAGTSTSNPLDQLIQFVTTALFVILL